MALTIVFTVLLYDLYDEFERPRMTEIAYALLASHESLLTHCHAPSNIDANHITSE